MLSLIVVAVLAAGPGPDVVKKGQKAVDLILTLSPELPHRRAWRVGWLAEHYSEKYGIDLDLFVAIIRQESSFRSGIKSCWPTVRNNSSTVTCDRGLAQINEVWIKTWDLDPDRLQYDDSYNLAVAARILKMLQTEYGDEPRWWGR